MAIRVPFSKIDKELGKKILDETTVTEVIQFVPGLKFQPQPKQVQMFVDAGDDILLPFHYARSLNFSHNENINDKWIRVIHNKIPEFIGTMRPYQNDILGEAIEILFTQGSVTIGTPPGSGKTIMASKLWHEIGLLGIAITNRKTIHKAWIKTFQDTCPNCVIWIVGTQFPNTLPHIIVSMDSQVENIPEEIRLRIGTVIFDEAHLLCTPTRNKMFLSFEPKYIILETATLEMNNGMHKMAHLVGGYLGIFKISDVPYNIYVIPTHIFGNQEYGKDGKMISASLQKSLVSDPRRQEMILTMIRNNMHRKFIGVQRVKLAIEELFQKANSIGIECDSLYGTKKGYKNSKFLIGTISKMGVGFDEANSCDDFYLNPEKSNVIIIMNSIKGWQLYEQVRGRVMRGENPCVIWLMDDNPSVSRHFNGLIPWFRETKANILYVQDYRTFQIPLIDSQLQELQNNNSKLVD